MKGLILAIDIGTSSLRSALFSFSGERFIRSTSHEHYALSVSTDRTAELDPVDLTTAFYRGINSTLQFKSQTHSLRSLPIVACGISTLWHSILGVDKNYEPLTPIYTWADTRSLDSAKYLRSIFSEKVIHARTGCMLRSGYWPAKLFWIKKALGAQRSKQIHRWVSPSEYLLGNFCDAENCPEEQFNLPSLSMVSATGLMNLRKHSWDEELISFLKIKHQLPSQFDFGDCAYKMKPALRRKFPELKETLFFPAIGDGAASNLGSNATSKGVAAVNYGTSAAIRILSEGQYRPVPTELFCYCLDKNRWVIGGAISNAGNARMWGIKTFPPKTLKLVDSRTEKRIKSIPHQFYGPEKVIPLSLPYLHGERSPTWCDQLPGIIYGLHESHESLDVLESLIEGTYLRLAQIIEPLENFQKGTHPRRLTCIISGGITFSPSSIQELCNVLGRNCKTCHDPEASLVGAALYALERLGIRANPDFYNTKTFRPNKSWHDYFVERMKKQRNIENKLKNIT